MKLMSPEDKEIPCPDNCIDLRSETIFAGAVLKWLPYPENKPEKTGYYLITIIIDNKKTVIPARFFHCLKQYNENGEKYYGEAWCDVCESCFLYDNVSAFMENPQPYEE